MKASKFSDAQKAFILKQGADGIPIAEICRRAGISKATYFNWKKKYDGLLPTGMKRLKQLEDEKLEDWRRYYNEVRPHVAIGHPRSRCSIPMAPPARHREKAGKHYLPAVQRMVSE